MTFSDAREQVICAATRLAEAAVGRSESAIRSLTLRVGCDAA